MSHLPTLQSLFGTKMLDCPALVLYQMWPNQPLWNYIDLKKKKSMGSLGGKRGGGGGGGSSISSLLLPRQPAAGPTTLNLHSHKILLKSWESISEKWDFFWELLRPLCLFYSMINSLSLVRLPAVPFVLCMYSSEVLIKLALLGPCASWSQISKKYSYMDISKNDSALLKSSPPNLLVFGSFSSF